MVKMPDNVLAAFNDAAAVKVLTSVGDDGQPHSIVCGSIRAVDADTLIVGEILMRNTAKNLKNGGKAALLVVLGKTSFLVDVNTARRVREGPVLDGMNEVLKGMGLKAAAVWVFSPTAVFDQSASPAAGTKLA